MSGEIFSESTRGGNPDPALPFFAYGLYRPGEIAFFQIKDLVQKIQPASAAGLLLIRDGVVVLDRSRRDETAQGFRIHFRPESSRTAYAAIQETEPAAQYKWVVADGMNVLAAVKPGNGARPLYGEEWSGWRDPAFGPALEVVEVALTQEFDWVDFKPFYRLQAAYMLLWSSIERYVSLRYGLGKDRIVEKVRRLGDERAFIDVLHTLPAGSLRNLRPVASTGRPRDRAVFDLTAEPSKLIDYLYQVRSNVTHRGKEQLLDWELLQSATDATLRAFRTTLAAAEIQAHWTSIVAE